MRLNLEARSYYKVKASGFSKKLMQQFLINCLNFLFPHRLLGNRLILLPDKAARGLNQTNQTNQSEVSAAETSDQTDAA